MIHYTYNNKKGYVMNNTPDTYEDYLLYDREYKYYEALQELKEMFYTDSIDRDDMDYPPMWEAGL